MKIHGDCIDAMQEGIAWAQKWGAACVAWRQAEVNGWYVYRPTEGCDPGDSPEFLCMRDCVPLALTDDAVDVWDSMVRQLTC